MINIGLKTDPVNTRFSFDWLFDLLQEEGIKYIQLGSFFELYTLDEDYFYRLKEEAGTRGIRIKSLFTSFRELGGFFYGDSHMERAARNSYEKLINVASILGADYCGSNPGAVYRDKMHLKKEGTGRYLGHMKELMSLAHEKQLKALTIETMSCLAEPPTLPNEMDTMIGSLSGYHIKNINNTVPVYLCGDISHGYANSEKEVIYSNEFLFEYAIKYMAEFHFKNTDALYHNTFGFSADEQRNGIIELSGIKAIICKNKSVFPVDDVIGYLEINGPKVGRDYTDKCLSEYLRISLRALRDVFDKPLLD